MNEVDQDKLQQSLDGAFAPGQLPFCHDASYQLKYSERWLCSLSEAEQQRCPAFKKLCATTSPEPEISNSSTHLPSFLGFLAELLFWGLIAALVVALIYAIAKVIASRRDTADAAAERSSLKPEARAVPAAPTAGDTDVARLLDKARRAADRGELAGAIDAAHAAAVQGLAAAGRIEVDRDRTNGDYVRDLRPDPPVQKQFKALVNQVEVTQFGGGTPTRGTFDTVLDQVMALLRRLAVLGLLLVVTSGSLSCKGDAKAPEREELSPRGLYTLRRLLTEQGGKVHLRVAPLTKIEDDVSMIVVYDTQLDEPQREGLLQWVRAGGSAAVVGEDTWLQNAAELDVRHGSCGHRVERGINQEIAPLNVAVLGEATLALVPKQDSVVVHRVEATCGGKPYAVTAFVEEGTLTFLPERELLSNASLSVADNARLVAERLAVPEGSIDIVGPWTGDGSQSPVQSIKEAGLLPMVLQLLGLAALLALRQGTSFGARRGITTRLRRAFADHVRALAATYARAKAGRLVSGNYGLLLIDQLRERVCPGQKPSLLQLSAAIARRVRRPETEIVTLLVEAKTAFDEQREGSGINHKLIRELEQLSLQAGGIS